MPLQDIWAKHRTLFIIAIIVVVILIGVAVYYSILQKGKLQGRSDAVATIPNPSTNEAYTQDERLAIADYSKRLQTDLHFYHAVWRDSDLYDKLSKTSDRILIGTSNQFLVDTAKDLLGEISNSLTFNPFTVDNTRLIISRLTKLLKK
jgi:hypothetical protein